MNIADLFDDSALDLELGKIKQKIAKLYNEILEQVFKVENPTGSEEELASFLEENGLQFNNEQGSFEEETSEIHDILDQMLSGEDTLDSVKDRSYSKPTVESGKEIKAHKETKDLPEMSSLLSVLNHTKHDYVFMCAKEDFSGYHNFTKSWSEHKRNAKRFQNALSAEGVMR